MTGRAEIKRLLEWRLSERGRAAVKAGAATLVAFFLTTALFVSPLLAAHGNFGHTHPAGTPAHTHPVSSVLGPALGVSLTTVAPFLVLYFFASTNTPQFILSTLSDPANGIRAPPLTR